jgi:hypothetical protein
MYFTTLRNASVSWIFSAWNWLKDHPQVICDSWRHASFKGWDLSYGSLTSERSRSTVYERFDDDQEFALSVVENHRQLPDAPISKKPRARTTTTNMLLILTFCATYGVLRTLSFPLMSSSARVALITLETRTLQIMI